MSATRTRTAFSLAYRVERDLDAPAADVWAKLTDAPGFAAWNSTVESIEGTIAPGEKLAIRVPIAPGRVFSPSVVAFEPPARMVWQDGFAPMFQGTRTFELSEHDGKTRFVMEERFAGVMLPLVALGLPDFVPVFDQYAADLAAAVGSST
ncbi:MAG: SRPBCC domain-containing protein [Alphaproteobacteria bacterium]|nr:SRPBCC domain-containing protein [Alphaproteobacteria bacterium]